MRALMMLFAALLLATTRAPAQDAVLASSHDRAAAELMEVLQLEETLTSSMQITMDAMMAQNPALSQFRGVMDEFMATYMSWEDLRPEYVRIYAAAFTEDELREITAFYRTPVGQKTVELLPELMQQGAKIGQRRVQAHLPELERMIREHMAAGGQ